MWPEPSLVWYKRLQRITCMCKVIFLCTIVFRIVYVDCLTFTKLSESAMHTFGLKKASGFPMHSRVMGWRGDIRRLIPGVGRDAAALLFFEGTWVNILTVCIHETIRIETTICRHWGDSIWYPILSRRLRFMPVYNWRQLHVLVRIYIYEETLNLVTFVDIENGDSK